MTHGNSNLHAYSLDMVVVEMAKESQSKGGEGHCSSVSVHHEKTSLVIWVIILKVHDDFPHEKWLDHFNGLLYDKDRDKNTY